MPPTAPQRHETPGRHRAIPRTDRSHQGRPTRMRPCGRRSSLVSRVRPMTTSRSWQGFSQEARLDWAGFFPYSAEDGTPAALLDGRVDPEIVSERHRYLQGIQDEITSEAGSAMIGRRLEVLVDQVEDGVAGGPFLSRGPRDRRCDNHRRRQPGRLVGDRGDGIVRLRAGRESDVRFASGVRASGVRRLMIVEVLAVGTELLLGQIVNGNAAKIGSALADQGSMPTSRSWSATTSTGWCRRSAPPSSGPTR